MAKALEVVRTLAGLGLLAGALTVAQLGSVEREGLAPSMSATQMCGKARVAAAASSTVPQLQLARH